MRNPLLTPIMIEKYAKRLVVRLKQPSLSGIVLTGSFARGEAGPYSDLDIWCFYKELPSQPPCLPELTGISLDLREVSLQEFSEMADGSREYVAPCFEQLNVYGDTPFVLPSRNKIKCGLVSLLQSIDTRLQQCVPPINHYELLNDIMYALRIEQFFKTSQYPLTLSELYAIQFEESDRFLVECYSSYLFGELHKSEDEIHSGIHLFMEKRFE
ncbi:nucleotidyltransferase domain-containing protein [Guptibacillus hwajinpoensis]|uniref:nucleotidyltransferase domain-containing protein n=1 Tax=Guptibacillus hwajinpoensis TaxID=208199 RepID=UPI00384B66CE